MMMNSKPSNDILFHVPGIFKRVSRTYGGEWAGPCPWCYGRDRFRVWPYREAGENVYWCRVCGACGDLIQFLRDYKGLSFLEACEVSGQTPRGKRAKQQLDLLRQRPRTTLLEPEQLSLLQTLELVSLHMQQALIHPRAQAYLAFRRTPLAIAQQFNLGYLPAITETNRAVYEQDKMLAYWSDSLVIPVYTPSGARGFAARKIALWEEGMDEEEHKALLKQKHLPRVIKTGNAGWVWQPGSVGRNVITVEGMFEVFALVAAGFAPQEIIGVMTNSANVDWFPSSVRKVLIAFNGDAGGRSGAEKLSTPLRFAGIRADYCFPPGDERGTDWSFRYRVAGSDGLAPLRTAWQHFTNPREDNPLPSSLKQPTPHGSISLSRSDNGEHRAEDQPLSDIAQTEEASPSPVKQPQQENTGPDHQDSDQVLIAWLQKRIGRNRFIYATGEAEYSKKYLSKPEDYEPDFRAYLAGNKKHILGSYLLREDTTTYVLAFDIDDPGLNARIPTILAQLASAGAAPIYWQRHNERGHLELYFDSPVQAEAARAWAVSVCPELAAIAECYPTQDKQHQAISWPFYQRRGEKVTVCRAKARIPGQGSEIRASVIDKAALVALIEQAITPAALVEAFVPPEEAKTQPTSLPARQETPSDGDLAKIVIAQFNQATTWEEVVALCGGFTAERKFQAVWRGERTASVAIDDDEQYACDYGRTGTKFPKKLDKYEVFCLAQGGSEFKRLDLARRIEAYRRDQVQEAPQAPGEEVTTNIPVVTIPSPTFASEPDSDVVRRLRGYRYIDTPRGRGRMWQLWATRVGVILDGSDTVTFFSGEELDRLMPAADQG